MFWTRPRRYISLEDSGGEGAAPAERQGGRRGRPEECGLRFAVGTASSHWEKRVLYNEVMSGTVNTAS